MLGIHDDDLMESKDFGMSPPESARLWDVATLTWDATTGCHHPNLPPLKPANVEEVNIILC